MRATIVLALALSGIAHADPATEVTKAFTAFVATFATDKPALAGVVAYMPPDQQEPILDATHGKKLFDKPIVKVLRVVASSSGKSAWIAANIAPRNLRASAFLVLEDGAWHVRAADFSGAVAESPNGNCGNDDHQWRAVTNVPRDLVAPVRSLLDGIQETKSFAALMSDDKRALLLGSAPGEVFDGGAAIKAVFKKWRIFSTLDPDTKDSELPADAGIGPDGELMWVVTPIHGPGQLCAIYRGFFVLAKNSGGWKIVHQHYSVPWSD